MVNGSISKSTLLLVVLLLRRATKGECFSYPGLVVAVGLYFRNLFFSFIYTGPFYMCFISNNFKFGDFLFTFVCHDYVVILMVSLST